jgi:Rrf2 family protein
MWIPVKSDDAVRAAVVLARSWPDAFVKAEDLAAREGLPVRFLENILGELRRGGIVQARRGYCGGYALTRAPEQIQVAEVLAAVGSPLVSRAQLTVGNGAVARMWEAVRESADGVLANCTLADLVAD